MLRSRLSLTLEVKFLVALLRSFAVAALSAREERDKRESSDRVASQLAHAKQGAGVGPRRSRHAAGKSIDGGTPPAILCDASDK